MSSPSAKLKKKLFFLGILAMLLSRDEDEE